MPLSTISVVSSALFSFYLYSSVYLFGLYSILYYTILNGLSNESRSLRELSLRNIGQSEELPLSGSQIGKLTFDPESRVFYWIRYRPNHEEGDVIEKYSIVDKTTVEIATRASQVEGEAQVDTYVNTRCL